MLFRSRRLKEPDFAAEYQLQLEAEEVKEREMRQALEEAAKVLQTTEEDIQALEGYVKPMRP